MDTRGSSPAVKRLGREADHSPPSRVEVNEWSYTSTTPYAFRAWCLIKHRDNFIFTYNQQEYGVGPLWGVKKNTNNQMDLLKHFSVRG